MTFVKKIFTAVVSGALAASFFAVPAFAAGNQIEPSYKVTLYSGAPADFNVGGASYDSLTWNVAPGAVIDFSNYNGSPVYIKFLTESDANKYYVKGVRLAATNSAYGDFGSNLNSGNDGSVIPNPVNNAPVMQDDDFVVTYGIKANRTPFVVNYVDAEGNLLGESVTYYGAVGDKVAPVAGYVEGYLPRENSQSLTLTGDPEQDVITFNYQKLADPEIITEIDEEGRTVIVLPGGETVVVAPAAVPAGEEAAAITTDDGTVILADDGTPLTTPIEEVNLDDDEAPLASGESTNPITSIYENPLGWTAALLGACVVAALALFFILVIRNKRKASEEQSASNSYGMK